MSRSSTSINNSSREQIHSLLQKEILYKEILEEMVSTGKNELIRGQEKYKLEKKILMIHLTKEPEEV